MHPRRFRRVDYHQISLSHLRRLRETLDIHPHQGRRGYSGARKSRISIQRNPIAIGSGIIGIVPVNCDGFADGVGCLVRRYCALSVGGPWQRENQGQEEYQGIHGCEEMHLQ